MIHLTLKTLSGQLLPVELYDNKVSSLRFHVAARGVNLQVSQIILIRSTEEGWERLGNFHTIQEGDEVSYLIRDVPSIVLRNFQIVNVGTRWHAYTEDSEHIEYNLLTFDFWSENRTFTHPHNRLGNLGPFTTVEELLLAVNACGWYNESLTNEQIEDLVHLWDVCGM